MEQDQGENEQQSDESLEQSKTRHENKRRKKREW